jgi:signal transduction histidine kinase
MEQMTDRKKTSRGERFRLKGIRKRWLLNNISVVLAAMLLLTVVMCAALYSYYYGAMQSELETRANSTAGYITRYASETYGVFYKFSADLVQEFGDADKLEMQVLNARGQVLFSSLGIVPGARPSTKESQTAFTSGKVETFVGMSSTTGERLISTSAPVFNESGTLLGAVRYVTSTRLLDGQLLRLYLLIGALMIFLSGVIIFANSLFIRSIVGPILQINQLAQTIKSGQYGARLDVAFNDEIGELCNTLNGMSAELARMEQVKNDFISSVSHELRTPLTAIKGWTETLMDEEDAALRGAGLRIMQKETGRLNQMVEELLDFSRMESGRLRLQTEYVDLRGELYDAVFIYRDMLAQEGLRVVYTEPEEPVVVNADRNRMKQVFLNVIDNAGKYGRDGDRVEVSIAAEAGNCVVHIRDFGQGIPAEELPRIKEKFFKGSAKGRGTGIGLAVCNEIVELHGGTLEVSSTYGAGTDVCVRLPLQIHKSEEQEQ